MAIGVIGGMFDLIADWLLDADPAQSADIEGLIAQLTDFFQMVRYGLPEEPVPSSGRLADGAVEKPAP